MDLTNCSQILHERQLIHAGTQGHFYIMQLISKSHTQIDIQAITGLWKVVFYLWIDEAIMIIF